MFISVPLSVRRSSRSNKVETEMNHIPTIPKQLVATLDIHCVGVGRRSKNARALMKAWGAYFAAKLSL
jgi:hypothetical protein